MDQTRLQNTRAWIAFVPHACTAFSSIQQLQVDMIFSESKINLFKALSIIVIRLGTQYYKCLSPESKYVQFKIHHYAIQPCHYKRPGGPATDKCTQSLKYSDNMTHSEGFTLLKSFIA